MLRVLEVVLRVQCLLPCRAHREQNLRLVHLLYRLVRLLLAGPLTQQTVLTLTLLVLDFLIVQVECSRRSQELMVHGLRFDSGQQERQTLFDGFGATVVDRSFHAFIFETHLEKLDNEQFLSGGLIESVDKQFFRKELPSIGHWLLEALGAFQILRHQTVRFQRYNCVSLLLSRLYGLNALLMRLLLQRPVEFSLAHFLKSRRRFQLLLDLNLILHVFFPFRTRLIQLCVPADRFQRR